MAEFLGVLFAVLLFGALGAWIFELLWNYFIPFFKLSLPLLTFWQAWGLIIALSILKGFIK